MDLHSVLHPVWVIDHTPLTHEHHLHWWRAGGVPVSGDAHGTQPKIRVRRFASRSGSRARSSTTLSPRAVTTSGVVNGHSGVSHSRGIGSILSVVVRRPLECFDKVVAGPDGGRMPVRIPNRGLMLRGTRSRQRVPERTAANATSTGATDFENRVCSRLASE